MIVILKIRLYWHCWQCSDPVIIHSYTAVSTPNAWRISANTHQSGTSALYEYDAYVCLPCERQIHNDHCTQCTKTSGCILLHGCFLSVSKRSYNMKIFSTHMRVLSVYFMSARDACLRRCRYGCVLLFSSFPPPSWPSRYAWQVILRLVCCRLYQYKFSFRWRCHDTFYTRNQAKIVYTFSKSQSHLRVTISVSWICCDSTQWSHLTIQSRTICSERR